MNKIFVYLVLLCFSFACNSKEEKSLRLISVNGKTRKSKFDYDKSGRLIKSDRLRIIDNVVYHNFETFEYDKKGLLLRTNFWSTINDTLDEKGTEKYILVGNNIGETEYNFERIKGGNPGKKTGKNFLKYDQMNRLIENLWIENGKFAGKSQIFYNKEGIFNLALGFDEQKHEVYRSEITPYGKIIKNPMALWKQAGVPLDFGFGGLPIPDFLPQKYILKEYYPDKENKMKLSATISYKVIETTESGYPKKAVINKDTLEYFYNR